MVDTSFTHYLFNVLGVSHERQRVQTAKTV